LQMIYFVFVASVLAVQNGAVLELTGDAAKIEFGGALTLIHNNTEDQLTCSGKIQASDVLIEGTSTTVAQMMGRLATLEQEMAAVKAFVGMMPPPASPPPSLPPSAPCFPYEMLDQPWRNVNNTAQDGSPFAFAPSSWYRFANTSLATAPPLTGADSGYSYGRCGGVNGAWLTRNDGISSTNPSITDGVIERRVCHTGQGQPCGPGAVVGVARVLNCGDFLIYQLPSLVGRCSGFGCTYCTV